LELYRVAFARLTFQDEYLFNFTAVFLTANGALAVPVGSELRDVLPNHVFLGVLSVVGIFLCVTWGVWTAHNDYWHSVWIGALRTLERQFDDSARLFDLDHSKLAYQGGRSRVQIWRGHFIAGLVPLWIGVAWLVLLAYCVLA
jgi:hypothetical protein